MSDRDAITERIATLEVRVLDGSDDRAYCLRWIGIHSALLAALDKREGRG